MDIKVIYTILLLTVSTFTFGIEKDTVGSCHPENEIDYCTTEDAAIRNLVDTAKTCIGIPYKYGGASKKGFDCSGFIGYVFKTYCSELPRSSREIAKIGTKISRKEIQKGDFIFFKGRNTSSSSIGHIAFVTEVKGGKIKMIHSTRRGVVEDVLSEIRYYDSRYLFAIRLDYGSFLNLY